MNIEIFLNNLSASEFTDVGVARQTMKTFINTSIAFTHAGAKRGIRSTSDIHSISIAPNYSIAKWRNDPAVTQEEKSYFRSLLTKYPVFEGMEAIQDLANEFECKCNDIPALGLLGAYLLDGASISLSSAPWDRAFLPASIYSLDSETNTVHHSINLRHASRPEHVAEHVDWIRKKKQDAILDGESFTKLAPTVFRNLQFAASAYANVKDLSGTDSKLRLALKKISDLNDVCSSWFAGPFPFERVPFKIDPESESTLNQFSAQRTFLCPDNQMRIFSDHFRLNSGWRVHLYVDSNERKIIIGYVGPHLPTALFN